MVFVRQRTDPNHYFQYCFNQAPGYQSCALALSETDWDSKKLENIVNKDQVKGQVESIKGKVKEVTGNILEDTDMEIEGNLEKHAGKLRQKVGDIKEAIKKES